MGRGRAIGLGELVRIDDADSDVEGSELTSLRDDRNKQGSAAAQEWDPLRADSTPFTELQIKVRAPRESSVRGSALD